MYTLLDYVKWRGDLSFAAAPFNTVDAMVLCELTYFNFDWIVSADFEDEPVTVAAACSRAVPDPLPNYCTEKDLALQELVRDSERYGNVQICGFRNIVDEVRSMQFCAMTFLVDKKTNVIAFRGTDDSLVGWKENMDLAYNDEVPAQTEAVRYLKEAAAYVHGPLYVGGHSKGGNLAVFSSAFCPKKVRDRIRQIYNFDGPGFNETVIENEKFSDIFERTLTFIPQDSMIGLLLEHKEDYIVIHSSESNGFKQHDLLTWSVTAFDIEREEKLTKNGENYLENISEWIASMTREEKETFIKVLFDLVEDYRTTDELFTAKNIWKILREYKNLPEGERKAVTAAVGNLKDTLIENWKEKHEIKKEEWAQKKEQRKEEWREKRATRKEERAIKKEQNLLASE